MHTVLTKLCTGCKLCIEPCPVDCITLVENSQHKNFTTEEQSKLKKQFAKFSRDNKNNRKQRLKRMKEEKQRLFEEKRNHLLNQ